MEKDKNPLEYISKVDEMMKLHDFLKDDDLAEAMDMIIKLITKETIPAKMAPGIIVKLQAISAKCAFQSSYYATLAKDRAGTPNNNKKNIYYTAKEALDKLCDSLKYLARLHE